MPAFGSNQAESVNPRAQSLVRRLLLCLTVLSSLASCGATKKSLIFEQTLPIPTGRFAGPIEVQLPRRAADSVRDYEIRTELASACGPRLRMSYPDGEVANLGPKSPTWQSLLARRAEAGNKAIRSDTTNTSYQATAAVPVPAGPPVPASALGPPAPATQSLVAPVGPSGYPQAAGHWQQTSVESWPGQMEFLRTRDHRCASVQRYKRTYTTAFDETGRLTIWAEVPQELANATLKIEVYEVIDVDKERRIANRERKRQRRLERDARVSVRVEAKPYKARKVKPRPPMPKPKQETPRAAQAEGARWNSGHWQWTSGKGKWVWIRGHWLPPSTSPPPKSGPGVPPIAGCTWHEGYWAWQQRDGKWIWTEGYWNPPPPKTENPGAPPVPESPWIVGRWTRTKQSFTWVSGHWGKPRPRAETPPPPPFAGANWQSGAWLQLKGKWIWSPGYYAESTTPPPLPKREVAGRSPAVGAVWLAGFWRWIPSASDYRWVAGHWETPPGAGYRWIPDPPDPAIGHSVSGHWKIIVDAPINVEVRR